VWDPWADTSNAATAVRFEYDDNNNRTYTHFPASTGVTVEMQYDKSNRQTLIVATRSGVANPLMRHAYSYMSGSKDTALRTSHTIDGTTVSHTYDGLNRLKNANGGTYTRGYTYDKASNVTSATTSGTTTGYKVNAANQLCWSGTGAAPTSCPTGQYTFDGNGNLTGSNTGWAFSYNNADQTTAITRGGTLTPFTYTGADQTQRDQAGDTTFVTSALGHHQRHPRPRTHRHHHHGGHHRHRRDHHDRRDRARRRVPPQQGHHRLLHPRQHRQPHQPPRRRHHPEELLLPPRRPRLRHAPHRQHRHQGQQLHLRRLRQQPAPPRPSPTPGATPAATTTPKTKLTKFGTRYYDPTIQRWTQRDPEAHYRNPTEGNRYGYAGSDPVNSVDQSGRAECVVLILLCWQKQAEVAMTPYLIGAATLVVVGTLAVACTVVTLGTCLLVIIPLMVLVGGFGAYATYESGKEVYF